MFTGKQCRPPLRTHREGRGVWLADPEREQRIKSYIVLVEREEPLPCTRVEPLRGMVGLNANGDGDES